MCKLFWMLVGLVGVPCYAKAQSWPTLRDLSADSVRVLGADCALFPAIALLDSLDLHEASTGPRRFTPTRQQVEAVEKQLSTKGLAAIAKPTFPTDSMLAFIQSNEALFYIHTHLLAYKRQYYGFYNVQHQPCLYINLVEEPMADWRFKHIVVMDGGTAFWRISYNLATRQFYGFSLNSEG